MCGQFSKASINGRSKTTSIQVPLNREVRATKSTIPPIQSGGTVFAVTDAAPSLPSNELTTGVREDGTSCRLYMALDIPPLPGSAGPGASNLLLTDATLELPLSMQNLAGSEGVLIVQAVEEPFADNVTWDTQPMVAGAVIDSLRGRQWNGGLTATFDITSIVAQWLSGEKKNYGISIRLERETAESAGRYITLDTQSGSSAISLKLSFTNMAGVMSEDDFIVHDAGLAGTLSISPVTGALTYEFEDLRDRSEKNPFSLRHIWHTEDYEGTGTYGKGFHLSLDEKMVQEEGFDGLVLVDAYGQRTYFGKNAEQPNYGETHYTCTENSSITLMQEYSGIHLYDADSATEKVYFNRLPDAAYLKDVSGAGKSDDGHYTHYLRIQRDSKNRISQINPASGGRYIYLTYDEATGRLASIQKSNGDVLSYIYDKNSNLTSFRIQPAGSQAAMERLSIQYGQPINKGGLGFYLLTGMRDNVNQVGTVLAVEYIAGAAAVNKVRRYRHGKEGPTSTWDTDVSFSYLYNGALVSDNITGRFVKYGFTKEGAISTVEDNQGNAQFYEFGYAGNALKLLSAVSPEPTNGFNLLSNPGFESHVGWDGDYSVSSVSGLYGPYAIISAGKQVEQMVKGLALRDGSYTFSADFRGITGAERVRLKLEALAPNNTVVASFDSGDYMPRRNGFDRLKASLTIPNGRFVSKLKVTAATSGTGTIWMDNAQLSRGKETGEYNLLPCGDFEHGAETFISYELDSSDGIISDPEHTGSHVFRIGGNSAKGKMVALPAQIVGSAGDVFTITAKAKAFSVPEKDSGSGVETTFSITAAFLKGEAVVNYTPALFFNSYYDGWQYLCGQVTATGDYDSVRVFLKYKYNCNEALFDEITLRKKRSGATYSYDENGRLVKIIDSDGEVSTANRSTQFADRVDSVTEGAYTTVYTYDPATGLVATEDNGRIKTTYTYSGGMLAKKEMEPSDGAGSAMCESTSYNGYGFPSSHSADGVNSTYMYDGGFNPTEGFLTEMRESPAHPSIRYEYDHFNELLTKVSNGSRFVEYDYTEGRITTMKTGEDVYRISYDEAGHLIRGVKEVNGKEAWSLVRTYDCDGRLETETFGGDDVRYTYGAEGRVSSISRNGEEAYSFTYDEEGRLLQKHDAAGNTSVTYNWDESGNLVSITDGRGSRFTVTEHDKTEQDDWTAKEEWAAGGYHSVVTEYPSNELHDGKKVISDIGAEFVEKTDVFGRRENTSIRVGSLSIDGTFGYDTHDFQQKTYTTRRLSSDNWVIGGRLNIGHAIKNRYNDPVAITDTVSGGQERFSFDKMHAIGTYRSMDLKRNFQYRHSYDDKHRLSEVEQWFIEAPYNRVAKVFTYDQNDPDLLASVAEGDNTWPLEYDAAGRLVQGVNGDAYIWDGRLLVGAIIDGVSYRYTYDHEGRRTGKTWADNHIEYFYSGEGLVREEHYVGGMISSTLNFYRDMEGNIAFIKHQTSDFSNNKSGTLYYLSHNSLGVLEYLVDVSGSTPQIVARYHYDAFGVPKVYEYGAEAAEMEYGLLNEDPGFIGNLNPYRYKSYYYDAETGFYALATRYYSPYLCRFISPDSFDAILLMEGQPSISMYEYCDNDPINNRDAAGEFHIIMGTLVGFIQAFLFEIVDQAISHLMKRGTVKGFSMNWERAVVKGLLGAAAGIISFANIAKWTAVTWTAIVNCADGIIANYDATGKLMPSAKGVILIAVNTVIPLALSAKMDAMGFKEDFSAFTTKTRSSGNLYKERNQNPFSPLKKTSYSKTVSLKDKNTVKEYSKIVCKNIAASVTQVITNALISLIR